MKGRSVLLLTAAFVAVLALVPGNPVSAFLGTQASYNLLQQLHPALTDLATNCFNQASAQLSPGVSLQVNSTWRSFAEQDQLYQAGKSPVPGGHSYHNYGLALDMQLVGVADWKNSPDWQIVVTVFKNSGFRWGGDFTKVDMPHFDKGFGYMPDQLLTLYNAGDFIPGTTYVNLNSAA